MGNISSTSSNRKRKFEEMEGNVVHKVFEDSNLVSKLAEFLDVNTLCDTVALVSKPFLKLTEETASRRLSQEIYQRHFGGTDKA